MGFRSRRRRGDLAFTNHADTGGLDTADTTLARTDSRRFNVDLDVG